MKISTKKKVCIIGAGASGLAAIRHVSESEDLEGVVFESSETIGGLWVYSDETRDENGNPLHSSMYSSIRTHLPKQLMAYPEFPFGETPESFLTHQEMLKYMNDYATHFQLSKFIKFSHKVIHVKPFSSYDENDEASMRWMVTVEDTKSKTWSNHEFHAVMVCNGHCFKPFIPRIKDQEVFKGEIMHSRDYRTPEMFQGKKAVIIGGGLSALDLATEVASTATHVTFSHKGEKLDDSWLPENVLQVGKINCLTENGIILQSGEKVVADLILLCTGYEYSYPFISMSDCHLKVVQGKYVTPLYRHFIHSKHPTISFLGLPFLNAAFPLFDCQARFFVKFLEGHVILPSEVEMNSEMEYEFNLKKNNGIPISKSHSLENNPWDLYNALGKEAGFDTSWVPLFRSIYNQVNERRAKYPTLYKKDRITVVNKDAYEYECEEIDITKLQI